MSQDSTDGLLVSFKIGIPVTYYGFLNTEYNSPHSTYLLAHDELISSFKSNLFTSMLDNQLHTYFYLQQNGQLSSGQSGTCHLKSHGSISLLSIVEEGWENHVDYHDTIDPITFYPNHDEQNEQTLLSSFQTGLPTFLLVVMFGGLIIYFIKESKTRNKKNSKDFVNNENDQDSENNENNDSIGQKSISSSYFKKPFKYIYDFARAKTTNNLKKTTEYQRIQSSKDDVESNHDTENNSLKDSIVSINSFIHYFISFIFLF